jgi:hypothetical protein
LTLDHAIHVCPFFNEMKGIAMPGSTSLVTYEIKDSVKLYCEINLDNLLPTQSERRRFDNKWQLYLNSDKANKEVYELRNHILCYESEQLVPSKMDKRPSLLLVLGNPASHSVKKVCFFRLKEIEKNIGSGRIF